MATVTSDMSLMFDIQNDGCVFLCLTKFQVILKEMGYRNVLLCILFAMLITLYATSDCGNCSH